MTDNIRCEWAQFSLVFFYYYSELILRIVYSIFFHLFLSVLTSVCCLVVSIVCFVAACCSSHNVCFCHLFFASEKLVREIVLHFFFAFSFHMFSARTGIYSKAIAWTCSEKRICYFFSFFVQKEDGIGCKVLMRLNCSFVFAKL